MEDKALSINLNEDEEEDEDSFVCIILRSGAEVRIEYSQLFKYSQVIKQKYPFDEAKRDLSEFIQRNQDEYNIDEKNIKEFFLLLEDKNVYLTVDNYFDFWKIAKILEIKKLLARIKKSVEKFNKEADFLLKMYIEQQSEKVNELLNLGKTVSESEYLIAERINECFDCDIFEKIPVNTIYRILEKSDKKKLSSDKLYKFIIKLIKERCILFCFIELQNLSDECFRDLSQNFRESNSKNYYDYFKPDFEYMNSLKEEKNELEKRLKILFNQNEKLNDEKHQLINLNSNLEKENEQIIATATAISNYDDSQNSEIAETSEDKKHLKEKNEYLDLLLRYVKNITGIDSSRKVEEIISNDGILNCIFCS